MKMAMSAVQIKGLLAKATRTNEKSDPAALDYR